MTHQTKRPSRAAASFEIFLFFGILEIDVQQVHPLIRLTGEVSPLVRPTNVSTDLVAGFV